MNSIANFAEADLLPKFQVLTGMHPDCPIPEYLRADANLFFTNFFSFRGAWPLLAGTASASAGSASASATLPLVAPTAGGGQLVAPTDGAGQLVAPTAAATSGSQLAPTPAACMKVGRGIDTNHQLISQLLIQLGSYPVALLPFESTDPSRHSASQAH
jgi:hypothetical protein